MKTSTRAMGEMIPCGRYDLFKRNYPEFEGTVAEALSLPLPVFEDKMWLVKRVFSTPLLHKFALAIAFSLDEGVGLDATLAEHLDEVNALGAAEDSEDNRRAMAYAVTKVYERTIFLSRDGVSNPAEILNATKVKQNEIIQLAKYISEEE